MIERIVSAAVYLVLPLVGILFFGWDWRSVIVLYWLQNITVGLRTEIDMIRTRTPAGPDSSNLSFTINDRPVSQSASKPFLVVFFLIHYGIFTLVHGVFVFLIAYGAFNGMFGTSSSQTAESTFNLQGILVVWAIGSIVQLVLACMVPRATLPPMKSLFFAPYSRIFVLHFTVIVGVFIITRFGWPPAAAILLVALQFVVDLWKPESRTKKPTKILQ
ncbi:MAG: DUF6498-containing protein [Leucobacter sp.]